MLASSLARVPVARRNLLGKYNASSKRCYGASGKRVHVETHDFFKADPKLIEKRKSSNSLHYIFLEGLAGSGKHELLDRLQKVGYTTKSLPYINFCAAMWHSTHFQPTSATVGMFWLAQWTKELELLEHAHRKGQPHKDNIIFVQRSPVSLWVHDVSRMQPPSRTNVWLRVADEVKSQFSCSTVLCHTEDIKLKQRMAERMFYAENEAKLIRTALREEDAEMQQLYESKYKELQEKEWIDAVVQTTSVKQAQAQILTMLGLDDWQAFKDSIPSQPGAL